VIDIQEKLLPVMVHSEQVIKNSSNLVQIAKSLEIPILWCQQVPNALGPTVQELSSLLADINPINKTTFSCCGNARFLMKLEELQATTAILCGIESHVCVFQTAVELIKHGLSVHTVSDAISSRTEENGRIGIERMAKEGANITSTEMLLFELLRDSKHHKFRELAKLIK
jgi:nicotinamidase-related amidase